jgi:hypothetical protein
MTRRGPVPVTFVRNRKEYSGPGIYCGHGTPFGNPFVIGLDGTRPEVIAKFEEWWLAKPTAFLATARRRLRGQILICWCYPRQCHCDFLAEWANAYGSKEREEGKEK